MLKAVLVDLNGIFIISPKLSKRFQADFGIPESKFLPKLFEIMEKVRKPGAGKAFYYWKPVLDEFGVNFTEEEFWDYWFKSEKPSEEIIGIAKDLRAKGIKVIIVSNNFQERAEYYGHYPWLHDAADKVYFSWQTGLVKPDPKAWEMVLKENDLKPEECIYFDDQEKNIKSAESLGIKSFDYQGPEQLKNIVESYG